MQPVTLTPDGAVVISHRDLVSTPLALQDAIKRAFGSELDCLGIVVVSDLPAEYPRLRERLLLLADRFAALDEVTREKYVDAGSHYRFALSTRVRHVTRSWTGLMAPRPALDGPMGRRS
jgi:hypothetical protein